MRGWIATIMAYTQKHSFQSRVSQWCCMRDRAMHYPVFKTTFAS